MSVINSGKQLITELKLIEDDCKQYISLDNYHVVKVKLKNLVPSFDAKAFNEELLCDEHQPNAVYFNKDTFLLFFPKTNETQQYTRNYHEIICKYTSRFIKKDTKLDVNVSIVEFDSQLKVITYLKMHIDNHMTTTIKELSGGKIDNKIIYFRTDKEIFDLLKTECSISWDDISMYDKYGSLVRLVQKKDKIVSEYMSKNFDARNNSMYLKYIFR